MENLGENSNAFYVKKKRNDDNLSKKN